MKGLWLLILCLLPGPLACQRLSNAISQVALDCGGDADRSGSYLKILDTEARDLHASDLRAFRLDASGHRQELALTSRACVRTTDFADAKLLVQSLLPGRTWGALLSADDLPWSRRLGLQDLGGVDLNPACSSPIYTQGRIEDPVLWPQGLTAAFPYQLRFEQDSQSVPGALQLAADGSTLVPPGMVDGPFSLTLSYQNLFLSPDDAKRQKSLTCPYILDRQVPEVVSSLGKKLNAELFQVEPGERISLQVQDTNAASLAYCLRPAEATQACADPEAFSTMGSEAAFRAPDSGKWCLEWMGSDKAALQSARQSQCFIAFQTAEVESIRELADGALLLLAEDQLAATVRMLKALRKYFALPTAEEKAAVRQKIFDSTLSVGSRVTERSRWLLDGTPRGLTPIGNGEGFLVFDGPRILQLWSADGRRLDQKTAFATDAGTVGLAVRGTQILAWKGVDYVVYQSEGLTLNEQGRGRFPQAIEVGGWHPSADEFVLGAHSQTPAPLTQVYRLAADGYVMSQDLPSYGAVALDWSADGVYLAIKQVVGIHLWERATDGNYAEVKLGYGEIPSRGSAFLKAQDRSPFFYVDSDGRLGRFVPDAGFEALDLPPLAISRLDSKLPLIKNLDASSALLLEDGGRLSLLTADARLETLPMESESTKLLAGRSILGWQWYPADAQLALHLNPAAADSAATDSLLFLQRFPGQKTWITAERLSLPGFSLREFARLGSASVTSDSSGRLRFWQNSSLQGSFRAAGFSSPFLKWLPDDQLVTAGYDSVARVWNLKGETQFSLAHNQDGITQINDVLWNQDQSLYVTVGEDASSRVWKRDHSLLATLDDSLGLSAIDAGKVQIRGTAAFAGDQQTLVIGGTGPFSIWEAQAEGYRQRASFFAPQGPLAHAGPGDIKIFTAVGQEWIWAARRSYGRFSFGFFDMQGQPAAFAKVFKGVGQAFDLSADGLSFALQESGQVLKLYRWDGSAFRLLPERTEDLDWTKLQRLSFSPDGQRLAGFFRGDRLILWEWRDGAWVQKAERRLLAGTAEIYRHVWRPSGDEIFYLDGNRIFRVDAQMNELGRYEPFDRHQTIEALALSPSRRYLAVSADARVRLLDLDMGPEALDRMCEALAVFFDFSNEFERSIYLTSSDRAVCR